MQHKLIFFGALAAFGAILFGERPGAELPASGGKAALAVAEADETGFDGEAMVLTRGGGGQFHLTAQVDGQDTEFLVDTGADMVALTVEEAERLGFSVDPSQFVPLTRTASGTGYGAVIRLGTLEVAGGEFREVEAMVLDGLPVNLLGQSVLSQLGQVSLEGDRMVIRR
ncbi:MAG: TIGR02281 family clan AA aspartic protease [Novosphingobium sp.]|nr:TIGR02281 family clan AA aspartic protease [Novosphingobium sp.]